MNSSREFLKHIEELWIFGEEVHAVWLGRGEAEGGRAGGGRVSVVFEADVNDGRDARVEGKRLRRAAEGRAGAGRAIGERAFDSGFPDDLIADFGRKIAGHLFGRCYVNTFDRQVILGKADFGIVVLILASQAGDRAGRGYRYWDRGDCLKSFRAEDNSCHDDRNKDNNAESESSL